jgi:hypothetical protein
MAVFLQHNQLPRIFGTHNGPSSNGWLGVVREVRVDKQWFERIEFHSALSLKLGALVHKCFQSSCDSANAVNLVV